MAVCHILFVCTGNTGRSVAAEALARRMIAQRGLAMSVGSRGVAVDAANLSAELHVVTLLMARGLDVSAHRARPLTAADIDTADQVLTMTAAHKQRVLSQFPGSAAKLQLLSAAACGTHEDVPDAFGAPIGGYERMLATLDRLVAAALERLRPDRPMD